MGSEAKRIRTLNLVQFGNQIWHPVRAIFVIKFACDIRSVWRRQNNVHVTCHVPISEIVLLFFLNFTRNLNVIFCMQALIFKFVTTQRCTVDAPSSEQDKQTLHSFSVCYMTKCRLRRPVTCRLRTRCLRMQLRKFLGPQRLLHTRSCRSKLTQILFFQFLSENLFFR